MAVEIYNTSLDLCLPEAVCFDLDNTLYAYEPANRAGMNAVFQKLIGLFTIEKEQIARCFNKARAEIKAQLGATAASHSRILYFQRMLEFMGLNAQTFLCLDLEQTYWRTYLQHCQLYDGVRNFLFELRSRNITTTIISDLTAQIQFRKLIYFDIDGLIDHVVTSEEAGADKPSPIIFELVLKKLQCLPGRVWMIGDTLIQDMAGAQQVGMIGILKRSSRQQIGTADISFVGFEELAYWMSTLSL